MISYKKIFESLDYFRLSIVSYDFSNSILRNSSSPKFKYVMYIEKDGFLESISDPYDSMSTNVTNEERLLGKSSYIAVTIR